MSRNKESLCLKFRHSNIPSMDPSVSDTVRSPVSASAQGTVGSPRQANGPCVSAV